MTQEKPEFINVKQVIFHDLDPMQDQTERKIKFEDWIIVQVKLIKGVGKAQVDLDRIARDAGIITLNPMPDVTIVTMMDGNQLYTFSTVEQFEKVLGCPRVESVPATGTGIVLKSPEE